jgi:hypothetical protein
MIASSAHRIGTHDARRYLKRSLANEAPLAMYLLLTSDNEMLRPCSGPARSRDRRGALTSRMPSATEVVP